MYKKLFKKTIIEVDDVLFIHTRCDGLVPALGPLLTLVFARTLLFLVNNTLLLKCFCFFIAKSLFGFSRLFFKLGGFIPLFVRFILMTFPIGKYKAQTKVKYAKDKYDEESK